MKENSVIQDLYNFYGEVRGAIENSVTGDVNKQGKFFALQGVSYCLDKLVNVYGSQSLLGEQTTTDTPEEKSNWCNLEELCARHPELKKSNIVSRKWRIENAFPFKSGYKCRQLYYEPDVIEWINQHLREK